MADIWYNLAVTFSVKGKGGVRHRLEGKLDLAGPRAKPHAWFLVGTLDGRSLPGDKFRAISAAQPPLEEAVRKLKDRVARRLGIAAGDLIFSGKPSWQKTG